MNEAVEHAAELADSIMKMLAQARTAGKMPTQDFTRAQALLVSVAVRTSAFAHARTVLKL